MNSFTQNYGIINLHGYQKGKKKKLL